MAVRLAIEVKPGTLQSKMCKLGIQRSSFRVIADPRLTRPRHAPDSASAMATDYASFPRVRREELRMLWIHDYNDGPLSGMLVYRGRMRWYECCDLAGEGDDERVWQYVIRDLTDAQIAEEKRWHALFVEHVGDHWTIHDDGHRGAVKPRSEHAKFYEPYATRTALDYSTCPIVGWFEM